MVGTILQKPVPTSGNFVIQTLLIAFSLKTGLGEVNVCVQNLWVSFSFSQILKKVVYYNVLTSRGGGGSHFSAIWLRFTASGIQRITA